MDSTPPVVESQKKPGLNRVKMSPHFVLGRENVPCVAEVVNRSLKADCTDFRVFKILQP